MEHPKITTEQLVSFRRLLQEEERSPATVTKYLREIVRFNAWLCGAPVTKTAVVGWKEYLLAQGYGPSTINGKLTALDRFFRFLGWERFGAKHLKLQKRMFRDESRELTQAEYRHLLGAAQALGRERLLLLMEAICTTGIRVSEVPYLTVEAVKKGKAEIALKGKIRTILIPGKLARRLLKYAKRQKIAAGEIFLTRSGRGISRKQIWAEMKALCKAAGVSDTKVFPHNLRHLFARAFYQASRDVAKLADILGHSSIETTRIYLISSGMEHARQMEHLGLFYSGQNE